MKVNYKTIIIFVLVILNSLLLYRVNSYSEELVLKRYLLLKNNLTLEENSRTINYYESYFKVKNQQNLLKNLVLESNLKDEKIVIIYLSEVFCHPCLKQLFELIKEKQIDLNYRILILSNTEVFEAAKREYGFNFIQINTDKINGDKFSNYPLIYVVNENKVLADNFLLLDYLSINMIENFLKSL